MPTSTSALFKPLTYGGATAAHAPRVTVELDGVPLAVPPGVSVAAALLAAGVTRFRGTPVSGSPRAPYCMMGACFECLMEIDGAPNRQTCLVEVREGMKLRTQEGARELNAGAQEVRHAG
jgi:D-hydroxyproline dehydrogenase subunit gamma